MNADLKSKTVKELYKYCAEDADHYREVHAAKNAWIKGFSELARRLEEAQQKIVAQQEMVRGLRHALGAMITEAKARNCGLRIADEVYSHAINDELSVLRSHDAAIKAEAKAEALEEAKAIVLRRGQEIGGAIDPERTASEIEAKAAEYRAKAGRKE